LSVFIPGGALALGATVFIQGSYLLGYPISVFRIRIRIGSGFYQVIGSGFGIRIRIQEGKNGPTKVEKILRNFMLDVLF
jgi:hypothetical protein